jgi:hypothetical protein
VLPSAAALLAGFLSILRDKPERLDIQTNRARLASLVRLSVSDFIHVDDFRGLPQILLLSIRQRFHPILIRLFTELSRLCLHSRFLLGRRRICLLWRLLSFSLLGRIHINGHGSSNMIEIQCHPAQVKSQWSKVVVSEGKRVSSGRLFTKARLLTRPTLAVISPTRPASAKTDSSPWDAPCPKQGRSSEDDPRFTFHASRLTVLGNDARTKLADFFNSLLEQLAGDGVGLQTASCR